MKADDECEVRGFRCGNAEIPRPLSADECRNQDTVPKAGHREQFGHTLKGAYDNGFEKVEVAHAASVAVTGLAEGKYRQMV